MNSEENPAVLKKQRAIVKGCCTRIRTYVESITTFSSSIVAQLEERKSRLDGYWSEYNTLQTRLEMVDDAEVDDRAIFEEAFYTLSAKIREMLLSASPSRHAAASLPSTSGAHENSGTLNRVRLPEIKLPTFSGKYDEWFPFFDTFNSLIHSNASLSNIQRFQYLRTSLSGDARNVVNSLEISDANYDVAWALLKERYDNQRVIV